MPDYGDNSAFITELNNFNSDIDAAYHKEQNEK